MTSDSKSDGPVAQAANPCDWTPTLESIRRLCAVPHMNIARLLRNLEADILHEAHLGRKNMLNETAARKAGYRRYRTGEPVYRIVPLNGRYTVFPSHLHNEAFLPAVADLIAPDTDAVVELGCGYGRNLFALRELVEHRFPDLRYFGGEISDTGLDGAHRIAALEPRRTPIAFLHFNYLQPAFPFLAGMRNVLFFTVHSIEQVKNIGATLFDRMLETAAVVQCFHAEPVGWQFNDAVLAELNRPGAEERLRASQPKVLIYGRIDEFHSAAAPWMNGWNRDLVHQLTRLADGGRIRIEFIDKFVAGDDAYNPSTFIQWRKV